MGTLIVIVGVVLILLLLGLKTSNDILCLT
jgi:hypothetical protein